jgi:hypothetical protein
VDCGRILLLSGIGMDGEEREKGFPANLEEKHSAAGFLESAFCTAENSNLPNCYILHLIDGTVYHDGMYIMVQYGRI